MENVGALLAHASSHSESELITQLESSRRRQRSAIDASLSSTAAALTTCSVTTEMVAYLVANRPLTGATASAKWQKRVFLLETAVAEAMASVGGGNRANPTSLSGSFKELLVKLCDTAGQQQHVAAMMTKMAVLLGCCWLLYDRRGKVEQTTEVLTAVSDFCLTNDSTQHLGKWPLFLLGMVHLVEKKEYEGSLAYFKKAVERTDRVASPATFHYWYAVALICNERATEAVDELDKCISQSFEPVACLSLQATVHVHGGDFHSAAKQLQRALEIDSSQSTSLFNYAVLLGQTGNYELQQQLLTYVVESIATADKSHTADKQGSAGSAVLFDAPRLTALFSSRRMTVSLSTVHLQLAQAAMENDDWLESKKYFDAFFGVEETHRDGSMAKEAARDYIYVLLQCNLPSQALTQCSQFLGKYDGGDSNIASTAILMLHLYKADALLCLERVEECWGYLRHTTQPKIQDALQKQSSAQSTDPTFKELVACHTQLLNNLAVVTACHDDAKAAIGILREGLQQYPGCLALQFNLVLLLWRTDEQAAACSLWFEARGWNADEGAGDVGSLATLSAFDDGKPFSEDSAISQHVHSDVGSEANVSVQQLKYLDALILNYWKQTRNAMLVDNSLQYVKCFENAATRGGNQQGSALKLPQK